MDDSAGSDIVDAEIVPATSGRANHRSQLRFALIGIGIVAFVTAGVFAIITFLHEDANKAAHMVRNHPIVIEQLGGIDECKYNFAASLYEGGKRTDVFDVRGPKGTGQLVTFEFFYEFRSIVLRNETGEWELLDDARPADDDKNKD
jgi:hypothetical protein